ncbi:MAG: toll/interleukin-1 receptor domain-containing protein, partial [Pseudomonadota bacterium]
MAKIFISYRREDSQYQADRLHTAIKPHVDDPARDIFIDIDNIPLGVNFATYLDGKVAECEVLLALIGPGWLEARDGAGNRRLDSPDDFVRIEIASALKRGIPVVPVLMDGAPVPRADQLPEDLKELALRNGTAISRSTFEADTVRMVKALGLVEPEPDPPARKKSRAPLIAVAAIAVIGAIIGGFALSQSQFWDAGESEWEPSDEASGVSEPTDTTLGNGDLYEVLGEDGALSPDIVSGESTVPGSAAG